ncbi:MAG: hypothetical protein LW884_03735 [Bacteroidetes bacterium]|jgi:hypothetical protein|nr:hypothetical protein [Bacteroidota bacterium]
MMKSILFATALLGLVACNSPKAKTSAETKTSDRPVPVPNGGAVEVVIYKTKPGIADAEAIEKARSVNEFIRSQDGFIRRTFGKTREGQWVDVIQWESVEKAQAIFQRAMESDVPKPFLETIDEKSMTILHADTLFTLTR